MTQEELTALVEILNRVSMTMAERLFIRTLVEKLAIHIEQMKSDNTDNINNEII